MKEDNSAKIKELRKSAADFGKEVDFQKQKLTTKPTPLPKPTGVEKIGSNDILSGSRYSDGIVTDQDKSTRQIQKQLRKDYQQPPGFGTPSYDKARDKIDIEFKKNLPGLPDSNVPAEAVPGSIRPQYIDPMKTSPAVPVPIPKPKAKPPEIDQRVPRPKMRPDKQGPIQRVKIKWPKEIQDRVPKSDVIPSGPGITTPGSMIYIEPKQQKLQDRVPQQKIQDRVPQQKIQDRVPPSAVNPKPTSAGPYAPAQSDDPFHQRYAKTASYLGQVHRDRVPPFDKQGPTITNTDNTKGAVAIPKPDSVGINVKPSKKAPETFKQIFARTPEGQKFTWTDPKTGKTGTYLRKTKK